MVSHRLRSRTMDAIRLAANPRLVAICLAGSFMLVVGGILGLPYLFLMSSAVLSLPIVGYVVAAWSLKQLSVSRRAPEVLEEGQEFDVMLTIRNPGLLPKYGMKVADRLPSGIRHTEEEPRIFGVSSQDVQNVNYRAHALRRGAYRIDVTDAVCDDLLGIFRIRTALTYTSEILVYPAAANVDLAHVLPSRADDLGAGSASMRRPYAAEINGVRNYYPGDELRRIHWPTSARAGDLVVMELEEGRRLHVLVIVDTSDQLTDEMLDCSARVARGICDALLSEGTSVTLVAGAETVTADALHQATQLYAVLARMTPTTGKDTLGTQIYGDSSSVVIVSGHPGAWMQEAVGIMAQRRPLTVALVNPSGTPETDADAVSKDFLQAGFRTVTVGCAACGVCSNGDPK